MTILLGSLHGIRGLMVSVDVVNPVPTARTPGSTKLEYDAEVEVRFTIGRVQIDTTITAGEYKELLSTRRMQAPLPGVREDG